MNKRRPTRTPKGKPAPRSPGRVAPWTATRHAAIEADPKNRPFIYLLTDIDGARLLAAGTLPEYLREQAERALDWMEQL